MLRAQVSYEQQNLTEHPGLIDVFFDADVTLKIKPSASLYDEELAFYQSIATSDLHVVLCRPKTEIPLTCLVEILYALLKGKPVLILGSTLQLPRRASFYSKRIIHTNSQHFYTIGIDELPTALKITIKSLSSSIEYSLNTNQKVLVKALVREQLHKLFTRARQATASTSNIAQ